MLSDQLPDSDVLHAQLKMVHLGHEVDDLLVREFVLLDLLECLCDLWVVHVQALVLFVPVLLLLQSFHQHVLLVEKQTLTVAVNKGGVYFLGKYEDVVERLGSNAGNLQIEFLDDLVQSGVALANLS